jgi:multiple RNA-binding domain-containing protein 1
MLVQEKSTNKEDSSDSESNDSEDSESDEDTLSHYMNHDDEQMKSIIPNKETNNNNNSRYQNTEVPTEESIGETGRLFVRNLPYICTEDDLRKEFVKFGPLAEVSN